MSLAIMRTVAFVDFAADTTEEKRPRNKTDTKSRNNASCPQWTAIGEANDRLAQTNDRTRSLKKQETCEGKERAQVTEFRTVTLFSEAERSGALRVFRMLIIMADITQAQNEIGRSVGQGLGWQSRERKN